MATPSPDLASEDVAASVERRLHPLSFLFRLRSLAGTVAVAVGAVLILRRGDLGDEIGSGLTAALGLGLVTLIKSRSYRYRLTEDDIVVREGVFNRTERHIPYARIQNVVQKRTVLHQLLGVAELRLESAGGSGPEAVMAVVTLKAAKEIEAVLGGHAAKDREARPGTHGLANTAEPVSHDPEILVRSNLGDLVRLGVATNRGWMVIGGLMAMFASLVEWKSLSSPIEAVDVARKWLNGGIHSLSNGLLDQTGLVFSGALALLILLKLLSAAVTVAIFGGFRLSRRGQSLVVEAGVLERNSSSIRIERIQRICIGEPWMARKMGRRWLACAVAASAASDHDENQLSWLVPFGSPALVEEVLRHIAPEAADTRLHWVPLHPGAWKRRLGRHIFLASIVSLIGGCWLGLVGVGLGSIVLVPGVVDAYAWGKFSSFAFDGRVLAFRAGGWRRQWRMTWVRKGQAVVVTRSPFDRMRGTAAVGLSTMGRSTTAPGLRIPHLPERQAQSLAAQLRRILGEDGRLPMPLSPDPDFAESRNSR